MDFESKKIWRYGDDVDTDVIIPARYLAIADWNELAEHAMEDIDTTFAPNVKAGEIMVAGKNFGCGSSREHAPGVIKAKGVPVIIAHSFARIFFRNAINIGLPVVEIGEQVDRIDAGDAIGVDLSTLVSSLHWPGLTPACGLRRAKVVFDEHSALGSVKVRPRHIELNSGIKADGVVVHL
ncbi:MAG: hypothetical protein E6951_01325 [Veillonella parvula]|nr:hypothetical protein [Veillonella parvula]